MPYLNDLILDNGLAALDGVSALYICSQEPSTFVQATSTYALGVKSAPTILAAANRSGEGLGRQRTIASINDGSITASGVATHWALVNTSTGVLYATNSLANSFSAIIGSLFTLDAFEIGIPDAISA